LYTSDWSNGITRPSIRDPTLSLRYRANECKALSRGDSELSALDAAKKQIQELLAEYLVSGDVVEAR
jgi:hypothetical protein